MTEPEPAADAVAEAGATYDQVLERIELLYGRFAHDVGQHGNPLLATSAMSRRLVGGQFTDEASDMISVLLAELHKARQQS